MNQFQELKERKVLDKDGKVDALGPYGRSKLTGQEVAQYFKKNKVKDAKIKKAVEVALDLGGADSVARKEIKKFYGDKILKSKEVQQALQYANESYTFNSLCAYLQEDLTLVEKNLMPAIEKIVADKGAAKIGGITIDMFTASVVKQVYDKVNDANKKKMEKANIQTLVKLAHKVMGMKEEVTEAYKLPNIKSSAMFSTLELDTSKLSPKEKEEVMKVALAFNKGARNNMHGQVEVNSGRVNPAMVRKASKLNQIRFSGKHDDLDGLKKDIAGAIKNIKEAANPAQQAAIAIAKKEKAGKPGYDKEGKSLKKEWKDAAGNNRRVHEKDKRKEKKHNVMDSYRQMWEDAVELDEEVADITVDPKNRINSGQQQGYHGMEIAKAARRMGLKSAVMHKHVRIKGAKKKVNDFLRIVIGKSRYGDPTEKDMSTPQIDKMLTKGLK